MRVDVDLGPTSNPPSRTDAPVQWKSDRSLEERLSEVERKLDQLLDKEDSRAPNAKILERLNELERKLDRVLDLKAGVSPTVRIDSVSRFDEGFPLIRVPRYPTLVVGRANSGRRMGARRSEVRSLGDDRS